MRRPVLVLAVALLLFALPGTAGASASYPVTIEVPTYFDQNSLDVYGTWGGGRQRPDMRIWGRH